MGRSGYTEDFDETGQLGLYRANVDRAIRGKRGQKFLREMAAALDAMPVKELITGDIVDDDGKACAIGSVALARKMPVDGMDVEDQDAVSAAFGIAPCLAAEISYENDDDFERFANETPAQRWTRMRKWVDDNLAKTDANG